MAGLIKINDLVFNGRIQLLAFDLVNLLALIPLEGPWLTWSIRGNLDVLGGGIRPPKRIAEQLKLRINLSPKGFLLSWEELCVYANSVTQISDGIFIGCKDVDLLPLNTNHQLHPFINPDNDLYKASEIVIEAYEGSFWTVYARDDALVEHYIAAFQKVEIIKTW